MIEAFAENALECLKWLPYQVVDGTVEGVLDPNAPDDGQVRKVPLTASRPLEERTTFPWPWGLVAIGVMALAWVGIYLLWNGIAALFNW